VKLALDSPAEGARIVNAAVVVSGTTSADSLTINEIPVPVNPTGRFEARFTTPAGAQTFRIVATMTRPGTRATETRTVTVAYTAAVVLVAVKGGDAWVQATVDGTVVAGTGRVYKDGETIAVQGRDVQIRTGNGAVTQITYNGQFLGTMGSQGQVVEKSYTAQ
jgi:hypothetical protein